MRQLILRCFWLCLFCLGAEVFPAAAAEDVQPPRDPAAGTVLAVDGFRFTLNGQPTFLLGVSYYGALSAAAGIRCSGSGRPAATRLQLAQGMGDLGGSGS